MKVLIPRAPRSYTGGQNEVQASDTNLTGVLF